MNKLKGYILLADDDLDDQYFIKVAIHEINPTLHIKAVDDGAQALVFLNKMKKRDPINGLPAFIITDLNMPRIDGFEFLKKVKSVKNLKEIPVFVLTTSTHEESQGRLRDYGALKCFNKPSNSAEFKAVIAEMISLVINY